jgi:hypothetical protein
VVGSSESCDEPTGSIECREVHALSLCRLHCLTVGSGLLGCRW